MKKYLLAVCIYLFDHYFIRCQQTEEILEGDVDIMMSTDNETGKMSTKDIKFNRAHTGFIFKEDKSVSTTTSLLLILRVNSKNISHNTQ